MNADENMKFDKNGKPRPWTADELRDLFGFDEDTDEVEFHGDRPRRADYRPPTVTFQKQTRQWPNQSKKMIQEAADSIRECAEYSLDLKERIECLKRAKRDYQDMLLGFSLQLGALLERGVNKYELSETMEAVKSYIDETDRALREAIDEYRNGPEPAERGGQPNTLNEPKEAVLIFRIKNNLWDIALGDERAPAVRAITDNGKLWNRGFHYMRKIVREEGIGPVRCRDMTLGVFSGSPSDKAIDDQGIKAYRKSIQSGSAEDEELLFLKKHMGDAIYHKKTKELFNIHKKALDTINRRIRDALKHLEEGSLLHDYFKTTIYYSKEDYLFHYDPQRFPLKVTKKIL